MAENVVINGTAYPEVEAVALDNGSGEKAMFYPDAVRYNAQTLTEEQKAQARNNIGVTAKSIIGAMDKETWTFTLSDGTVVSKVVPLV